MDTITPTEARKKLYQIIGEVNEHHRPIQIVGRHGSAVVVSEEDWRAIQETLYLLSFPGMGESIRKGLKTPVAECRSEIDW